MRFEVGKETLFVRLADPVSGWTDQIFDTRPMWEKFPFSLTFAGLFGTDGQEVDVKEAFVFKKLKCTEHHRVKISGSDMSGELESDGFVFEDVDGWPWHNQYPEARQEKMEPGSNGMVFKVGGFGKMVAVKYCLEYLSSVDSELQTLIRNGEPFKCASVMTSDQLARNRELRVAAMSRETIRELQRLISSELERQLNLTPQQL